MIHLYRRRSHVSNNLRMILGREVFSAFDLLQRRREVVCKPFAVFDFLELVRDAQAMRAGWQIAEPEATFYSAKASFPLARLPG